MLGSDLDSLVLALVLQHTLINNDKYIRWDKNLEAIRKVDTLVSICNIQPWYKHITWVNHWHSRKEAPQEQQSWGPHLDRWIGHD